MAITFVLVAMCVISAVTPGTASDQPRQGYPPLAAARITVHSSDISVLRDTLRQFSEHEHLAYLEGQLMRNGRVVQQFYLKEGDAPVIVVDNFRDLDTYQAFAYGGSSPEAWEPRWDRFLASVEQALGTQAVKR